MRGRKAPARARRGAAARCMAWDGGRRGTEARGEGGRDGRAGAAECAEPGAGNAQRGGRGRQGGGGGGGGEGGGPGGVGAEVGARPGARAGSGTEALRRAPSQPDDDQDSQLDVSPDRHRQGQWWRLIAIHLGVIPWRG